VKKPLSIAGLQQSLQTRLVYFACHHWAVSEASKRNGGVDDFETRTRGLVGLEAVGELVLGEWMKCALRGARTTLASQLSRKSTCEKAQGGHNV
jgi:hypothetical protein